jgi:acyl-CoA thioester hydrolase
MQYDQQFSIKTSITQYNGCKIRLSYIVYNEEGKIAADGYTTHCFTTPEMKILRVNKTNPQIHEKIASLVSD